MKVVILCGGMGTRIREVSELVPKPMVDIGGRPILWHVMSIFARHGYRDFVLCLGFKGNVIKDYFMNYHAHNSDIVVGTRTGGVHYANSDVPEDWNVTLVETGLETMTAGRVKRAMPYVGEEEFLLTYADGLAPVNFDALLAHHRETEALATITAIHPPGRFGELEMNGDKVVGFNEKPQVSSGYINGGFMVLTKRFMDEYVSDDPTIPLEREPLMRASRDGVLAAYKHDGWWQCMDTAREHELLNAAWKSGVVPWR
jgi:glucose-1-phosphate cytidylyltransferase